MWSHLILAKMKTMMHLIRGLHFICALYNINLRASHIEGFKNVSADAISRNNLQVFFRENPTANSRPTRIPEPLWKILVTTQPDWLPEYWRQSLASSLETALRTAQGATQPANPFSWAFVRDSTCSLWAATDIIHNRFVKAFVILNHTIISVSGEIPTHF